ncbi:transglutaminase-like enzyme, predicted cysteine protease [Chthonomonas calidirosea]|uniref:Transglutaminase-like enzymes, putative cysteine proteases n=1 Tax=Chthonomonas calidirosea (strain DSM 23976 / ICMP 18418 / T49) TaxID=1303518 RepID=S0EXJ1_CHTCT|nr:transglutaminase domain-containing protein [Chthonomonas calidirosea]CCW34513.1 Transglutaminase-like enzymes, putative cysteine proteases [Chthonomonas calidirosea T49]CEK14569.1 transglutaminase-like enzyme, predicted cysteine protease [Chthonomonas calidirosea]
MNPEATHRAGEATSQQTAQDRPSILLYLAGLVVTLSGLFAVNYTYNDPGAQLIYLLAAFGYASSYFLRWRGVKTLSVGLLLLMIGLAVVTFVNPSTLPFFNNQDQTDDRILGLLQLFVWASILHSYTLLNDSTVLFACVPCMTMLALVSARNPDPAIHQDFLVFVAASIFLLIHENYLRTTHTRIFAAPKQRRSLYSGQIALALACLFCTLVLSNLVATPLRAMGQALFGAIFQQSPYYQRYLPLSSSTSTQVQVSERNHIRVASGPVTSSDQPLFEVTSPRPLYWRGEVLTLYNGIGFEAASTSSPTEQLFPAEQSDTQRIQQYEDITGPMGSVDTSPHHFILPLSPLELDETQMQHSMEIKQRVHVVGGTILQIYGAGNIRSLDVPYNTLAYDQLSEKLSAPDPLHIQSIYTVVSRVPTEDPSILRKASSSLSDVPPFIRDTCLQTAVNGHDDPALRQLALQITRGLHNNYDKASAIRAYIASHCKYNLHAPPAPTDQDVVDYFLFKSRQGYCDSFGAAMVMLCRYAGIPARLASGFITGEVRGDNTYLVREKDKHIWAEVFFPQIGWVPFDATEGAQEVTTSPGTMGRIKDFLSWCFAHGALPALILCTVMALLTFVLWNELGRRLRRNRWTAELAPERFVTNREVIAYYLQLCSFLARKGLPRASSMTPDEYLHTLTRILGDGDWQSLMQTITQLYTEARYSSRELSTEEVNAMKQHISQLRTLLRHYTASASRMTVTAAT